VNVFFFQIFANILAVYFGYGDSKEDVEKFENDAAPIQLFSFALILFFLAKAKNLDKIKGKKSISNSKLSRTSL
jgi:hypothetical protein